VTVRTAGGERQTRLVLLPRIWVGGFEVEGVTVGVCDECVGGDTVGLLGLNVSGRFLVTVDQARHEILLRPRTGAEDRTVDITHWVDLSAEATRYGDGRIEVAVQVENRSDRRIHTADVEINCNQSFVAALEDLAPRKRVETVVSLPPGTDCSKYTIRLDRGTW
jgi:hypothetical protein